MKKQKMTKTIMLNYINCSFKLKIRNKKIKIYKEKYNNWKIRQM